MTHFLENIIIEINRDIIYNNFQVPFIQQLNIKEKLAMVASQKRRF